MSDPSNNTINEDNVLFIDINNNEGNPNEQPVIPDDITVSTIDYPRPGTVKEKISVFQPDTESVISGPSEPEYPNATNRLFPEIPPSPAATTLTSTRNHRNEGFKNDKFNIFKNEYIAIRSNNLHVLKESKECKRLLDLKYNDLLFIINNIQTSVIFTSTVSGFLQATKKQFSISEVAVSIASISIATFISLILSISKYYALDDLKERIQLLREKYSLLLNEIDYNMDRLGPWSMKRVWKYEDHESKYEDWLNDREDINNRYNEIVNTKKELVTEYECIMDTKSRNHYHTQKKNDHLKKKKLFYEWEKKEVALETTIARDKKATEERAKLNQLQLRRNSIMLSTEELDNWSFDADDWTSV